MRYIFLALVLPLVHTAFSLFVGLLVICYFFRSHEKLWRYIFYFSMVLSVFGENIINVSPEFLPPVLSRMVDDYLAKDIMSLPGSFGAIIIKFLDFGKRLYINLFVIIFIFNRKRILNSEYRDLYLLTLIFMSFSNTFMFVASLGSRFLLISFPFVIFLWFVTFKSNQYKTFVSLIPLVFFYDIFAFFVKYSKAVPTSFWYSSPFNTIFNAVFS